jgi:hypothetical protein
MKGDIWSVVKFMQKLATDNEPEQAQAFAALNKALKSAELSWTDIARILEEQFSRMAIQAAKPVRPLWPEAGSVATERIDRRA